MAIKYRNEDKSKPNIVQTESVYCVRPKVEQRKSVRRGQDNVKNVSVGIYEHRFCFQNF